MSPHTGIDHLTILLYGWSVFSFFFSFCLDQDILPGTEVTALLKRSDQCQDDYQAGLAAAKGAKFVVIQLQESTSDQDVILTADSPNIKLSVPVISISHYTGEAIKESGTMRFIRIRETLNVGE